MNKYLFGAYFEQNLLGHLLGAAEAAEGGGFYFGFRILERSESSSRVSPAVTQVTMKWKVEGNRKRLTTWTTDSFEGKTVTPGVTSRWREGPVVSFIVELCRCSLHLIHFVNCANRLKTLITALTAAVNICKVLPCFPGERCSLSATKH